MILKQTWTRPLHETFRECIITDYDDTYSHLPPHEALSLYHPKTKEKQEEQNICNNLGFSCRI